MLVRIIPTQNNSDVDADGKPVSSADLTQTDQIANASHWYKRFLLWELIPIALIFVVPLSVHLGWFPDFVSLVVQADTKTETAPDVTIDAAQHLSLLSPVRNSDVGAVGGGDVVTHEGALISTGPVAKEDIAASRNKSGEISVYTVRPGDSLSQVAEMYDVTTNTIMWANNLSRSTEIQPGDVLVILPVAGVRHTVKKGDTYASIIDAYDADLDEVLEYNNLDESDTLPVGEELIIPGGAVTSVRTAATPVKTSGGTSASSGGSWLAHPAPGTVRTQGLHGYNGIDFGGPTGTTVRAAAAGEVIVSRVGSWNGGYGNYVVIKHNNGAQTLYAHMSSVSVAAGEYVGQGATIGGIGNTGRSTGPHLHFEVRGGSNPF